MQRRDNYALARDQARELFLKWDQKAIIARAGIRWDSENMYISLIDQMCRVERETGRVYMPEGELADFSATLTIYDYLCRTDPLPPEGRFVAMGDLPHTGQVRPETKSVYLREAEFCQQHMDGLCDALDKMGGASYPHGDIGRIMPLVGDMRCAFQFWEGDEEFPPNITFLWDENAWLRLKCETMYYAMGCFFARLHRVLALTSPTDVL